MKRIMKVLIAKGEAISREVSPVGLAEMFAARVYKGSRFVFVIPVRQRDEG